MVACRFVKPCMPRALYFVLRAIERFWRILSRGVKWSIHSAIKHGAGVGSQASIVLENDRCYHRGKNCIWIGTLGQIRGHSDRREWLWIKTQRRENSLLREYLEIQCSKTLSLMRVLLERCVGLAFIYWGENPHDSVRMLVLLLANVQDD